MIISIKQQTEAITYYAYYHQRIIINLSISAIKTDQIIYLISNGRFSSQVIYKPVTTQIRGVSNRIQIIVQQQILVLSGGSATSIKSFLNQIYQLFHCICKNDRIMKTLINQIRMQHKYLLEICDKLLLGSSKQENIQKNL
ncbi:hypothetical protein pb186bvf_007677 [Paramecium bursaria]